MNFTKKPRAENVPDWNEAVSRLLQTTKLYWKIPDTPLAEQVRHLKRFYRLRPLRAPAFHMLALDKPPGL